MIPDLLRTPARPSARAHSTARPAASLARSRAAASFASLTLAGVAFAGVAFAGQDEEIYPAPPAGPPPASDNPDAVAADAGSMKDYTERVPGTEAAFEMVALPAGRFQMGSPSSEKKRKKSEGPVHEVEVSAFWIGRHEITWEVYHEFMHKLDLERRKSGDVVPVAQDAWADAVSRPTPPYVPMDFDMGVDGYPAVCMTQFAAKQFTKWLSMKTGRFYRLPTEAEWEYACRAGTTTAYSFGDDPADIDEYAWYFDNADDAYQKVGTKKPNPWGLYDMHGNVAEWVLDRWDADFYERSKSRVSKDPIAWPTELYPRVARGGSWDDDAEDLRSAARKKSRKGWKVQDPQLPKSIWYHTDAAFVGIRVVRPLVVPSEEEQRKYWEADLDEIRDIEQKQRRGER